MGRVAKWIGISVLGLLVLFVAAVVAVVLLVNPNDYKGQIEKVVQEQTGRQLAIEGDLKLSVFPWLGLELGKVRLSNAKGFGSQPMLQMQQAHVAVEIIPLLLHRRVVMDKLTLKGLRVHLSRHKDGKTNWDDLLARFGAARTAAPAASKPTGGAGAGGAGPSIAVGALGGVEISDAQITWDDARAGVSYRLAPLNVNVGALHLGAPVPVSGNWKISGGKGQELSGTLDARLNLGRDMKELKVQSLELQLKASGGSLPQGGVPLVISGNPEVNLAAKSFRWPDMTVRSGDLKVTGSLAGTQKDKVVQASAKLVVPDFNARDLLSKFGVKLPPMADADTLTKVGGRVDLQLFGNSAVVNNLHLTLDDSTLTGSAKVRSFAGPAADFSLALDKIDLDRYLPPPAKGQKPKAATPATAAAAGAEALPVDKLRKLDVNGDLKIGELTVKKLKIKDFVAKLRASKGVIRLHPLSASLYGGKYDGDMRMNAAGKTPKFSVNEALSGIHAGPLLKDLMGDDKLSGTGDVSVQLNTAGNNQKQWLQGLDGHGKFKFANGAVKGINLAAMVREAQARLQGKSAPTGNTPNETDFTELTGTFTAKKGVITNNDLDAKSPLLRVTGKGEADLVKQQMNYLLTVNLVGTLQGQGGQGLADLRSIPLPVRIKGSFSKPSYSLDLAAALRESQKQRIKEKEQQLKQKATQKLEQGLQNLLKGH